MDTVRQAILPVGNLYVFTDLGTGKNVVIPISMPIPMQIMSWVLVKMSS